MKKIILLFALFLSSMSLTVNADVYIDGLKKMASQGMSAYNTDELTASFLESGISEDKLSLDDIIDITVDVSAPYYRKYFTEEQFEQLIAFYSQPEILALNKKNTQFINQFPEKLRTYLSGTAHQIKNGQKLSNVKALSCSKAYKDAFEKYWEMNSLGSAVSKNPILLTLKHFQDGSKIVDHVNKNFPVFIRNGLLEVMNEEELTLYTSVTEKPFGESLIEVNKSIANDGVTITNKIKQKILYKLYGDSYAEEALGWGLTNEEESDADNEVYTTVEQMPQFPGGASEMMQFIKTTMSYPQSCYNVKIEGRTIIQFVVEKDGNLSGINVVRSSGSKDLDREAVRIVNKMPVWEAGQQGGKAVRCKYTLPITFRIADVQPK